MLHRSMGDTLVAAWPRSTESTPESLSRTSVEIPTQLLTINPRTSLHAQALHMLVGENKGSAPTLQETNPRNLPPLPDRLALKRGLPIPVGIEVPAQVLVKGMDNGEQEYNSGNKIKGLRRDTTSKHLHQRSDLRISARREGPRKESFRYTDRLDGETPSQPITELKT